MYVVENGTEKDGGLSGDLISLFCVLFLQILRIPKPTSKQPASQLKRERTSASCSRKALWTLSDTCTPT